MKKFKNRETLDKTPKYTVKDVAQKMKISAHTVRYYDNEGLMPFVSRTQSNIRKFSDYDLSWLKTVHCLRATNLSINDIKKYIDLCFKTKSWNYFLSRSEIKGTVKRTSGTNGNFTEKKKIL